MEVNEYWNDRNAPERVGRVLVELGAGQMEQPVKMKAGKVLKPETGRTTVRRATRIIGHLTIECQVMLSKLTPIAMHSKTKYHLDYPPPSEGILPFHSSSATGILTIISDLNCGATP
ncbi:hypothetical protein [Marinobacter lipolyticus]|uniref:hypothetical protein n=1 Tax=Marinobacter lipolyticus TaxID=209639 RepID=UPI0011A04970|nr:hypothetical protein [Marinobacter lipolyticus]